VIAYASASAVSASDVLAMLEFSYSGEGVNTTIEAASTQRNDNNAVAEEATKIAVANLAVEGVGITLQGNIGASYYLSIPDEIVNDPEAYMLITMPNGQTEEIALNTLEQVEFDGMLCYKAKSSIGVSAKEMNDDIVAEIYYNGEVVQTKNVKVKNYAEAVKNNSAGTKLESLTNAMVHYGAMAQIYFDYNADDLANQGFGDYTASLNAVTADKVAEIMGDVTVGTDAVELYSVGLLLKSQTVMRMFFKIDGVDAESVTFNGKKADGIRDGLYYVDINNISAKNLDDEFVVEICVNGELVGNASYCPMRYVYNVITNSNDEALVNVVKALYLYNQAANNYFGN
jgi:hypothetical protein